MLAPVMKTNPQLTLALALSLAPLGCAENVSAPVHHGGAGHSTPDGHAPSQPGGRAGQPLSSTPLVGPLPSLDKVCEVAQSPAGGGCEVTAIKLPPGAPFRAALIRAKDPRDPRYAPSGAFFVAVGGEGGWYLGQKPLDQVNGAAGKTYLPVVTVIDATAATGRALFHLRDSVSSVCNLCEPPERDVKKPVKTTGVVLVCGRARGGAIACTDPIEIDDKATVKLGADGSITVTAPGGGPKAYSPPF
jgi:hypothetical protein